MWIDTKDKLPEPKELVVYYHELFGETLGYYDPEYPKANYHWISQAYGDNNDERILKWKKIPKENFGR